MSDGRHVLVQSDGNDVSGFAGQPVGQLGRADRRRREGGQTEDRHHAKSEFEFSLNSNIRQDLNFFPAFPNESNVRVRSNYSNFESLFTALLITLFRVIKL